MSGKVPFMLIILDGWGINEDTEGNAIHLAETKNLNRLKETFPSSRLKCSGKAVGLPEGFMGNSEVGHLNIGAGRVIYQDLLRISLAIEDGSFYENDALNQVMSDVKNKGSALHLIGLVSDGGVHSHIDHLFALLDMAKKKGLGSVYVHAITDGRDTPPHSGKKFVAQVAEYIKKIDFGTIATVCGRYYAMDRDTRWDRTQKAYDLYTRGIGVLESDPVEAVKNAYEKGETDEFIKPVAITDESGEPSGVMKDKDAVIFFNFRADRARQITRALTETGFDKFERQNEADLCGFVSMTMYDEEFTNIPVAFTPQHYSNILGEVISRENLTQLRIAETEKYAHVTYFFNGGEEEPFPGEDRKLIPSPREVPTYDKKPEMSAYEVTEEVIRRIHSRQYDLIVLNFANMDMVGHTGIMEAAIKACRAVDECVGKIVSEIRKIGGELIIIADHGNSEQMIDTDGGPHTAHTLNDVPFILVSERFQNAKLRDGGILGDVAPTILDVMNISQPGDMTGTSMIQKK